jgi:hypothetical protein
MFPSAMVGAAVLLGAILQEAAPTVCTAPQPPAVERPEKPSRPPAPSCVDEARSRHTCSARVIGAYEQQLASYTEAFDAYVGAVNAYITSLSAYVEAVNGYVRCEERIVMPSRLITG